ncbi:hypothetical protein V6N11_017610 [Hibiscus sabdariffa]|uniref:Uncharacterized protein n=1 Tax=Hibiscus sabdariffa TaxID=183260 RepID=A0ABR2TYM4_9ROSI
MSMRVLGEHPFWRLGQTFRLKVSRMNDAAGILEEMVPEEYKAKQVESSLISGLEKVLNEPVTHMYGTEYHKHSTAFEMIKHNLSGC